VITGIKLLRGIGKFYGFSTKTSVLDWKKNTFVFAPNAYGKSTLVNVLCSLRDNDPRLIRARRTLSAVADPAAVIVIDGEEHVFGGTSWDKPFASIQVFDVPFIRENILAHEIAHEHKKSIHRIIVGAQGVKLAAELAELKTKEKAARQDATKLAEQFKRGAFTVSLDAFLAIPPSEEAVVDLRIRKLEKDLKSKASEAEVLKLGFPRQASSPSFDLSTSRTLAAKRLAAAHKAAEERVLSHINRNFKDKAQARQFIRKGLDLVQADCPFCGQGLKNAAELLEAYQGFFDEAFRAYQQGVAQQLTALGEWNVDNDLTSVVSTHHANLAALRQWEPYLGIMGLPDTAVTAEKSCGLPDLVTIVENRRARLVELKAKVLTELGRKQRDPDADADMLHFDALSTELAALETAVKAYNIVVTIFAENAREYLANLPKSDAASIRAALAKEQQTKMRFASAWKKWATDYLPAKDHADTLLTQKNVKQKELEDYSKTIFGTYQQRINELLETLGADFSITDLAGKTDDRANESYSDFALSILEQTVPLSARQDDAPCFKNTLSEGDKSALAFAFFIAALEKMPELSQQIVVFDDPLSSLDETRREATARLLLTLSPTVGQLNVFTHKKDFLYMLCDNMPDGKVLQVRSDKKNGSQLAVLDVEDDRKGDHAHLLEDMERYLAEDFGPTPEMMQGNIRKVFETVLKTKYYLALAADMRGKKGLAKLSEKLFAAGLVDGPLKVRLFHLGRLANGPHHGEIVDAPSGGKLTRGEMLPLVKEALAFVQKV